MPGTECKDANSCNNSEHTTIIWLILFAIFIYLSYMVASDANKQHRIEHQAKIKVCKEKEYINTSMCKQLLFDDRVEQLEVRS